MSFTEFQQNTFAKVTNIRDEIEKSLDPTKFELDQHLQGLFDKLHNEQANCDHIFENGVCIVCGYSLKEEEE